ncbi:hypothetical protein HED54_14140 [Ochrobactrum anthropi ATCC 49188]|nr:hypothetical protein [Brucella anthropi ATCC 49188]
MWKSAGRAFESSFSGPFPVVEDRHERKYDQQRETNPIGPAQKRRAEELRANLMRRKAQSRSRRAGEADERNDGITAASDDTD